MTSFLVSSLSVHGDVKLASLVDIDTGVPAGTQLMSTINSNLCTQFKLYKYYIVEKEEFKENIKRTKYHSNSFPWWVYVNLGPKLYMRDFWSLSLSHKLAFVKEDEQVVIVNVTSTSNVHKALHFWLKGMPVHISPYTQFLLCWVLCIRPWLCEGHSIWFALFSYSSNNSFDLLCPAWKNLHLLVYEDWFIQISPWILHLFLHIIYN